ncbi:MAG: response regulator transcription factor [Bacteroidetes bacterium]|nr:response regulator transcription factor [Bacteroidota bacterium]
MNPSDKIRLLVIEDNATLVVAALRNFFRPDRDQIEIFEAFDGVDKAVNAVSADQFDLVLLDLMIPGSTPKENMLTLHHHFPQKPVVIYSSLDSDIWRRRMMVLGAHGYVHKNDGRDRLKKVISDAVAGKTTFSLASGNAPAEEDTTGEIMDLALTVLEKKIVSLVADGMGYKEIAAALNTQTDAIETTLKRLRKKHNAKTTPQLIYRLSEKGLV